LTFKVILILALLFLLLIQILVAEGPLNSNAYELQKQSQNYTSETNASICGNQGSLNYKINQKLINFKERVWDNSTAIVNTKVYVEVYNSNRNLVAKSNETNLELLSPDGLPFEKRILINLICTNNSNSFLQFPVREDITITKSGLEFSPPALPNDEYLLVKDHKLKAKLVVQGLDYPTTMAFLGQNDILVLEKDKGTVQRIVNGKMLEKPLLDVNVSGHAEDGLVGIAITNNTKGNITGTHYVYLYFTESANGDITAKNKPQGNRIYRYEFANNQLVNPKLILDLPHGTRGIHNGGKMIVGADNNLYVTVGDVGRGHWSRDTDTKAQNNKTGQEPDGTGGILRFTQDGEPVGKGILGSSFPLNLYYAYGIRNSFGMDFDPITGKLWDTEAGNYNGDEINLVEPGFNSGWPIVEGMISHLQQKFDANSLVEFNGKGKYSDPEFNWYAENLSLAVTPTALKFIKSDKYGKNYENDMLMADFNHGHIYHFDLSKDRTELSLSSRLAEIMNEDGDEKNLDVILAKFPGGITDLQLGPDGYIYVVSLSEVKADCDHETDGCLINGGMRGAIFRLVPEK
jgi:aldose sugar dehydrogenase